MLKYSILFLLFSPLFAYSNSDDESYVSILQYHHVSTTTPRNTSLSPELFEQHLQLLDKEGFVVWPLAKLLASLKAKVPVPPKVVAITFDDGYSSVYENAYPLLKKHGFPFTIFVATDDIQHHYGPVMNWSQLHEMYDNGATIANHTKDHVYLVDVPGNKETQLSTIKENLQNAELRLQHMLGKTPKLLAYPYGEYTLDIKALVKSMGFIAFGQQSGPINGASDFQALPRYPLSGAYSSPKSLHEKLYTLPLPVIDVTPTPVLTHDRKPELSFGLSHFEFKPHQLHCYATGQGIVPVSFKNDRFTITLKEPFKGRRGRINCTAPANHQKGYYWYSKVWIFEPPKKSTIAS
jgi:peptidoglycan/xylan/chitin deacetylase (PgdA/CDA1 family)